MPIRFWVLFLALQGAVSFGTTLPIADECIVPILAANDLLAVPAATLGFDKLQDGSAFDPKDFWHALARPLLAIRSLHQRGLVALNGTPYTFVWNGRDITVWVVENSCTGDYSPVGEHCADLEFIVNSANGKELTFHASQPMMVALQRELTVAVDLCVHRLTQKQLSDVFGPVPR